MALVIYPGLYWLIICHFRCTMYEIQELFSDEHILVVNKPPGLRTIADGYNLSFPYLRPLLEDKYNRLWIVHRLDKDTSGLIILARTPAAHKALNMQFEAREVLKTYHAIIIGIPNWQELTITYPLRKDGDRKHRTVIDLKNGKQATTKTQVINKFDEYCLVTATPRTGYTHQIRVHLTAAGFPVLSDPLYSNFRTPPKNTHLNNMLRGIINRVALHAFSLEFSHPQLGTRLSFQAPYPQDFAAALLSLQSKESGE